MSHTKFTNKPTVPALTRVSAALSASVLALACGATTEDASTDPSSGGSDGQGDPSAGSAPLAGTGVMPPQIAPQPAPQVEPPQLPPQPAPQVEPPPQIAPQPPPPQDVVPPQIAPQLPPQAGAPQVAPPPQDIAPPQPAPQDEPPQVENPPQPPPPQEEPADGGFDLDAGATDGGVAEVGGASAFDPIPPQPAPRTNVK